MAEEKVLYEVKDKIAWITLNRPESLNAVNRDMVRSIVGYCKQANEDRNVQIVIFKANGEKAFSVGGDIKDRVRTSEAAAAVEPESPLVLRQAKYTTIPGTPAPAIAAIDKITMALVHGYTVGTGLLMSLACESHRGGRRAPRVSAKCGLGLWQVPEARSAWRGSSAFRKHWRFAFPASCTTPRSATASVLVNQFVPYDQLIPAGEKMAASFLKRRAAGAALYQGSDL